MWTGNPKNFWNRQLARRGTSEETKKKKKERDRKKKKNSVPTRLFVKGFSFLPHSSFTSLHISVLKILLDSSFYTSFTVFSKKDLLD